MKDVISWSFQITWSFCMIACAIFMIVGAIKGV